MNRDGIRALILDTLNNDIKVYPDYVPERKPLPAITYTHIANNSDRRLDGDKTGGRDSYRIRVISESRSEGDAIIDQLQSMDNTSNDNFKNIFVLTVTDNIADPDDRTFMAFVDIQVFNR
mgnify:CR=1 FL=1